MTQKNNTEDSDTIPDLTTAAPNQPIVTVDYERYAHYLDGADLTDEQKQEYLQTIWSIIVEFVSLGFGVHPLQHIDNACGESAEQASHTPILTPDMIHSGEFNLIRNFKEKSEPSEAGIGEGVE